MSSAEASSSSNSYYPNWCTDFFFFLMVFVLLFNKVLTFFFKLDLPVALSSLTCAFVPERPCASVGPSDLCKCWEDKRKAASR